MVELQVVGRPVDQPHPHVMLRDFLLSLVIEHVRDVGSSLVPQSSFTSILEGLLVHILTYLEGDPLSLFGIPSSPSVIALLVLESGYGVLPFMSVGPPVAPFFILGTPLTLSTISCSVPVFENCVMRVGVSPLSILYPHMESHPTRLTMPHSI